MKNLISLLIIWLIGVATYAQKDNTDDKTREKNKKSDQDTRYQEGASGVKRSISYKFNDSLPDEDPGEGIFRYNNDTLSAITYIFMDVNDLSGEDQTKWYSTWEDTTGATGRGRINIVEYEGKNVNVFDVTGVFVRSAGYWKIPVKYVSGSKPSNGVTYYYIFERIENKDKDVATVATAATTVVTTAVVAEAAPEPVVQITEPEPVVQNTEPEPVVQNTEPEPVVQITEPEPVVQITEPEPVVQITQPEPVVQITQPEPVVQITQPEPVVQITQPEPVVQITQPEPVVPITQPESGIAADVATVSNAANKPAQPARQPPVSQPKTTTRTRQPQQTAPKTTQTAQQTQPAQPSRQTRPAQPVQPNLPTRQAQPAQPSHQTRPAQPVQPTQPTQPTRQAQPTWPAPTTRVPSTNSAGTAYSIAKRTDGPRIWHGIIETGYGFKVGDYGIDNYRINFISSFSLGQHFMIGLGLGFRRYFDKPEKHDDWYMVSAMNQVPVFLDLRVLLSKKKLTPYLALGLGSSTEKSKSDTTSYGSFINPSAGIWYRLSKNTALFAGVAYEMMEMEYALHADNIPYRRKNNAVSLNIGIQF